MITPQSIDRSNMKEDLAKILDRYSSKELTQKEIQSLNDRDKNVKYYLKLLDNFKDSSSSSEDLFMNSIIIFMDNCMKNDEDELHQVLLIYLLLVGSYVSDFFNTQDLKDKKRHIKKIKKLFLDAIKNILVTYEKELLKTIRIIEFTQNTTQTVEVV